MPSSGESIAGVTAARELRALGHTGSITIVGGDKDGAYARPPLPKVVLHDPAENALLYRLDGEKVDLVPEPAVAADLDDRAVITSTGRIVGYDAPIAATGAVPAASRLRGRAASWYSGRSPTPVRCGLGSPLRLRRSRNASLAASGSSEQLPIVIAVALIAWALTGLNLVAELNFSTDTPHCLA
ncbi:FAD/NAD(P)-binding oxidoreductase [Nocardia abscessus]|uniref:FAD/NAD(P)-binding oxidoreductase n=1 Tax=Nocardia abscessus TaxID=120957 RepID=UPI0024582C46|nr:FAD/NAD(P)-binding oxidoreductase [Nocardia abscessus]